MGVTLSGQDLGMSKQLAHDGQILSVVDAETSMGVSQIVDPDILDLGVHSDAVPGFL